MRSTLDELVEVQRVYEARIAACAHDFTDTSLHAVGPVCAVCGVMESAWLRRRVHELETLMSAATRFEFGRFRAVLYSAGPGWRVRKMPGDYDVVSSLVEDMTQEQAIAEAQRLERGTPR